VEKKPLKKEKRNMDLESVESHTTEFKSSWRDEYLKWICAFANTNGGRLLIGVDDNGNPVGVKDSKKLLFLNYLNSQEKVY